MVVIQPLYALLLIAVYFAVKNTDKMLEKLFERYLASANTKLANLTYLFTKYVIYGLSAVTALFAVSGLLGVNYNLSAIVVGALVANLGNFAAIAIIIAVSWFIVNALDIIFEDLRRKTGLSASLVDILHLFLKYLIYFVAALMVILTALSAMGLPSLGSSMLTMFTVFIGLIVSFAATGTIGNALAGFVLISWRPFKKGDRVLFANGVYGDVISIDVMFTQIRTIDDELVSVPNLAVLGGPIKNHSTRGRCLVKSKVTIGYDIERKTVEELLLKAAERTRDILKEPKPFVLTLSLDNYYVSYEVKGHMDKPNRLIETLSELNCNILDVFGAAGVQIMSPDQFVQKNL